MYLNIQCYALTYILKHLARININCKGNLIKFFYTQPCGFSASAKHLFSSIVYCYGKFIGFLFNYYYLSLFKAKLCEPLSFKPNFRNSCTIKSPCAEFRMNFQPPSFYHLSYNYTTNVIQKMNLSTFNMTNLSTN